jgi:hypothetical protein
MPGPRRIVRRRMDPGAGCMGRSELPNIYGIPGVENTFSANSMAGASSDLRTHQGSAKRGWVQYRVATRPNMRQQLGAVEDAPEGRCHHNSCSEAEHGIQHLDQAGSVSVDSLRV